MKCGKPMKNILSRGGFRALTDTVDKDIVIGFGFIESDFAYGFLSALEARRGGKVYLLDIKKKALGAGVGRIENYIGKLLERGCMSQKAAECPRSPHPINGY
jgi:3-hydroxyacyl-CoA dehydrogenase